MSTAPRKTPVSVGLFRGCAGIVLVPRSAMVMIRRCPNYDEVDYDGALLVPDYLLLAGDSVVVALGDAVADAPHSATIPHVTSTRREEIPRLLSARPSGAYQADAYCAGPPMAAGRGYPRYRDHDQAFS